MSNKELEREEIEISMSEASDNTPVTGDIVVNNNELNREEHKMLNHRIALGLVGLFAFIITFVLEVFGAAGAIWGFAEVITLRKPTNSDTWRIYACVVGFFALLRYIAVHMMNESVFERYEREIDEVRGFKRVLKAVELPIAAVRCSFRSIFLKCKKSLFEKV